MQAAIEKVNQLESEADKADAMDLLEQFQQLAAANGDADPEAKEDLLADLGSYGITEADLAPADESVTARPLTVQEAAAVNGEDPDDGEPAVHAEPEASSDEEPVTEPDGQTTLPTGDPIMLTTEVHGPRPSKAEVKIKAFKDPVGHDLDPGARRLYIIDSVVNTVDGLGSDTRTHNAEALDVIFVGNVLPGDLTPNQAMDALRDLQTRRQRDRAVIDHACRGLEEIADNEAYESTVDLVDLVRSRLYDEYSIPDDPFEAGHGTVDHEDDDDGFDDVIAEADDDTEEEGGAGGEEPQAAAEGNEEGWEDGPDEQ